jgi:PAS domain S-box-containing protein
VEVSRLVERRTRALAGEMIERRRITGALARSEQRLRTLVANTPVGIIEMTSDSRIVQANPYFCQLLEAREPALVGRGLLDLVEPDARDEVQRAWAGVAGGSVDRLQRRCRLRRDDRSLVSVDVVASPIRDAKGRIVRVVSVIQDLSESERRGLAEMAREKAEAASRAKTEFVARMSHELRTPLNAMLGFAQLLANRPDQPLTPEQADAVRVIEQSGWHLLDMINELLELSRIESGHIRVELGPVDLEAAVAECIHLVGSLGTLPTVTISTRIARDAVSVLADSGRLRQVLLNLLSNAIKYNRAGGTVRIEAAAVPGTACIELRVHDTGTGMTEEQLAHLFEPFNRLGRDDTIPGTGIGLVIARNLVELMNGTLAARSRLGEGSCFTVTLPSAPRATSPAPHPLGAPLGRAMHG